MANFKVELELNWLDEDENLDDTLKQQVISSIQDRVIRTVQKEIEQTVKDSISKQVSELVNTSIKDRIETYLSESKTITDKYGKVIDDNFTIEKLIQNTVEQAMTKKTVDDDGKVSKYSPSFSLLEFCAMKNIDTLVDNKVKIVVKDTQKLIEESVATKVKTHVADNLTNMIMKNSSTLGLKG